MSLKEMLENILICPITQADLRWKTEKENVFLQAEGHAIYYPVVEGIALLLPEYAIQPTHETEVMDDPVMDPIKAAVQTFYDQVGWKKAQGEHYRDACDSEDQRPVSQEYIERCHARVKAHLPASGRYLLDIACGPIQYPAYLRYSQDFEYRICADLSLTALQEAKARLGEKGIYLLCDITRLPLKKDAIDAIVSLHTLYHVPAAQQATGFAELYRVLKPGGKLVVVYSWGARSILMTILLFPFKIASFIRRQWFVKQAPLYFFTHSYGWFRDEIQRRYPTTLFAWRSVNVPFLKIFVHPFLGGRVLLKGIAWLEERYPRLMGRMGAYPLWVSEKK